MNAAGRQLALGASGSGGAPGFDASEQPQFAGFEAVERACLEGGRHAGVANRECALGDLHAVVAQDPGIDLGIGRTGGGSFM